jgi:hypothetical protein
MMACIEMELSTFTSAARDTAPSISSNMNATGAAVRSERLFMGILPSDRHPRNYVASGGLISYVLSATRKSENLLHCSYDCLWHRAYPAQLRNVRSAPKPDRHVGALQWPRWRRRPPRLRYTILRAIPRLGCRRLILPTYRPRLAREPEEDPQLVRTLLLVDVINPFVLGAVLLLS